MNFSTNEDLVQSTSGLASPPSWLSALPVSTSNDPELRRLHVGERDAIQLALDCSAQLILLDDKAARNAATERKLEVAGLLGVLVTAAERGLVDIVDAVDRLQQTNFRASPSLLQSILTDR